MANDNKIGSIPEFTKEEDIPIEEVKPVEEIPPQEVPPEEKPAEEPESTGEQEAVKPADKVVISPDTKPNEVQEKELEREVMGLSKEANALKEEIKTLRGERREIKQAQLETVETQIKESQSVLEGINPEDVAVVEKIVKSRGFVSKDEINKIFYNKVKDEQLNSFLDRYPEFKVENDPHDRNWNSLVNELKWFRQPDDPKKWGDLLERARKAVSPTSVGEVKPSVTRQIKTASMGTGGNKASSSLKSLTPAQREAYSRGGFTEEEIANIEKEL
jgi:hypothetical protein